MSVEEFIEQVWYIERVLIKLPKRKKNLQLRPYPYQRKLSGAKKRDYLILNRIQPCIGKLTAFITDFEGNEISRTIHYKKLEAGTILKRWISILKMPHWSI